MYLHFYLNWTVCFTAFPGQKDPLSFVAWCGNCWYLSNQPIFWDLSSMVLHATDINLPCKPKVRYVSAVVIICEYWNLAKSCMSLAIFSVDKSFCNFTHGTAVILLPSVQNFRRMHEAKWTWFHGFITDKILCCRYCMGDDDITFLLFCSFA